MTQILEALGDPTLRSLYLIFCFSVMIAPLIAMTIWYHRAINKSAGGRKLMERQNLGRRNLATGLEIARGVESGDYGDHAKQTQRTMYVLVFLWLLAVVVVFGVLLWADEVNRPATSAERIVDALASDAR